MAKFVKSQHTDFNHLWWLSTKYSLSSLGKKFYVCKCVILYNSHSQVRLKHKFMFTWLFWYISSVPFLQNAYLFLKCFCDIMFLNHFNANLISSTSYCNQLNATNFPFQIKFTIEFVCILEWVVINDKNLLSTTLSLV